MVILLWLGKYTIGCGTTAFVAGGGSNPASQMAEVLGLVSIPYPLLRRGPCAGQKLMEISSISRYGAVGEGGSSVSWELLT